jgi:hypothetical protein
MPNWPFLFFDRSICFIYIYIYIHLLRLLLFVISFIKESRSLCCRSVPGNDDDIDVDRCCER